MVGYGNLWLYKGYVPHKYTMSFLPLSKTWTATFLLTLVNITELYSWCSVQVEKEGIQVIVKTMGSVWSCVKTLARFPIYEW
jgi:hypothetical protein